MTKLLDNLPSEAKDQLRKCSFPTWMEPMLATLTHQAFSDENWIFERKLDGERCLTFQDGSEVRLMSRNRKRLNETYPELAEAINKQATLRFVLDGEIVAFEGKVTSFSRLQHRIQIKDPQEARDSNIAVYYYLFDMPYLDGYDLRRLPLRDRKSLLRRVVAFDDPLRWTPHRNKEGESYYAEACGKGWEGLIAKEADSLYLHSRSKHWLKFKCVNRQEFVIGGYTDPQGRRSGFGALLIGYYHGDDLVYAGKVGTGYSDETLERLSDLLISVERKTPAFVGDDLPHNGVHWVTPSLVGEVRFSEWTEEGKLRHPTFLGLRRDKDPKNVVREKPDHDR